MSFEGKKPVTEKSLLQKLASLIELEEKVAGANKRKMDVAGLTNKINSGDLSASQKRLLVAKVAKKTKE